MEEEKKQSEEKAVVKPPLQQVKESWYDKVTLSVRQLDLIVGICWVLIGATVVLIALDALDIFHLFG